MNSTPYSIKDFAPIPIDSIKIGSRFRKDLGDIASPAEDIGKIGLLHPIVINQKRELISGLRRIDAFKLLGKSEIPAHIVNLDDIVKGEISENTQRKDFSLEEIIQIKKAVEPEIKTERRESCQVNLQQNLFLVTLLAPVLIGLIILAILIGVGYWIFGKIRSKQHYEIR